MDRQWLFDESEDRNRDAKQLFAESKSHVQQYPHVETMRHFIGALFYASGLNCNYWEENGVIMVQVDYGCLGGPVYAIEVSDAALKQVL